MSLPAKLHFVTADVFTSKRYEGNPLAIIRIPPDVHLSQDQKQAIAREFNLSESTFLHENDAETQESVWTVDIFLTTAEIPFAGHPTIGTACYILGRVARERGVKDGVIEGKFNFKAGPVGLQYDVVKKSARAAIPHDVRVHKRTWTKDELLAEQPRLAEAQQEGKVQTKDEYPVVSIVKGMTFILIELESVEALGLVLLGGSAIVLDGLDDGWNKTFIASYFFVRTREGENGVTTLRTRMIEGTLEDPATGAAASALTAYLSLTEGRPNEILKFEIVQGVEMGRRSEIFLEVVPGDSGTISEIRLEGGSIEVMEGQVAL